MTQTLAAVGGTSSDAGIVLFVEDNPDELELLASRLELKLRCRVERASSIEDGLRFLRERAQEVAAIVTDLHFGPHDPQGGLRIVQAARGRDDAMIQVIVLTAYPHVATAVSAMKLGAVEYLDKDSASYWAALLEAIAKGRLTSHTSRVEPAAWPVRPAETAASGTSSSVRQKGEGPTLVARQYVVSDAAGLHVAAVTGPGWRTSLRDLQDAGYQTAMGVRVLASQGAEKEKLVEIDDGAVQRLRAAAPSLIIEENIEYSPLVHPTLGALVAPRTAGGDSGTRLRIRVVAKDSGAPVARATVHIILEWTTQTGWRGVSDAEGMCSFALSATVKEVDAILVCAAHSYWSRIVRRVAIHADTIVIDVEQLVIPAPYGWGQRFSGLKTELEVGGAGVKVALLDSGVRSDHPGLTPAGGRNCVLGENPADWNADEDGHGSHCAGILSGHDVATGFRGYAPLAELRSYRVMPTKAGASTYAIVTAIEHAVEDGCDILSMSFGSETLQHAIRMRVEYAYERGVLCVAAAGNDAGKVRYPAGLPLVLGVGAFGQYASYPEDSVHRQAEGLVRSAHGSEYVATFSNFGTGLDLTGPGVAVVSTVPGGYCAWDGTSMACPQVAGIAALLLASDTALRDSPRDAARVDQLRSRLTARAKSLGFGVAYEGIGALVL